MHGHSFGEDKMMVVKMSFVYIGVTYMYASAYMMRNVITKGLYYNATLH
jgi:hypothetical protein